LSKIFCRAAWVPLTYNLSTNKVSLTDQFTFITATQLNIVSPFVTETTYLLTTLISQPLPGPEPSISTAIFGSVPLAVPSTSTLPLSQAQSSAQGYPAS
jgi:hypothetical protein